MRRSAARLDSAQSTLRNISQASGVWSPDRSDPAEQRRRVTEFLRSKKLDLPVLLDSGKEAFTAFHTPGLPSLVIIGRDGRLARYHSGVLPDMVDTVRGEIQELLK